MKWRAVFIDVDGTLLTDKLTISEGTREVLSRLDGSGVLISIVTARSPGASLFLYRELGIASNPIVCFNGALILRGDEVLLDKSIDPIEVKRILDALKGFEINTSIYRHRDWFTEEMDEWIAQEIGITGSTVTVADFSRLLTSDFYPNKLLCMGAHGEIEKVEMHLVKSGFDSVNIHKSKNTYLEIVNKEVSKMRGIQKILDNYGIPKEDIVSIGDNFNDIEMLAFSGMGIAMGNAPAEVKRYAAWVTDTNNNEGIQKALNMLFRE